MGSSYWQPRYVRDESEGKKNLARKTKKTPDSLAGKKVMTDRLNAAKKDLKFWTDAYERDLAMQKRDIAAGITRRFRGLWGSDCVKSAQRKVKKLEKQMQERWP